MRQAAIVSGKKASEAAKVEEASAWAGLLTEESVDIKAFLKPESVKTSYRNIAGTDVPVFEAAVFAPTEYDLFLAPLWVDAAIDALRAIVALREEIGIFEEGITILRNELRTTTQRVNLFEKVKIPQAEEAIRRIKIFIGDQMTNAVGRGKIAKKKIGESLREEVFS